VRNVVSNWNLISPEKLRPEPARGSVLLGGNNGKGREKGGDSFTGNITQLGSGPNTGQLHGKCKDLKTEKVYIKNYETTPEKEKGKGSSKTPFQ